MLASGVVLLQQNAQPHFATLAMNLLWQLKWEVIEHPSYSSDLAQSDDKL